MLEAISFPVEDSLAVVIVPAMELTFLMGSLLLLFLMHLQLLVAVKAGSAGLAPME